MCSYRIPIKRICSVHKYHTHSSELLTGMATDQEQQIPLPHFTLPSAKSHCSLLFCPPPFSFRNSMKLNMLDFSANMCLQGLESCACIVSMVGAVTWVLRLETPLHIHTDTSVFWTSQDAPQCTVFSPFASI